MLIVFCQNKIHATWIHLHILNNALLAIVLFFISIKALIEKDYFILKVKIFTKTSPSYIFVYFDFLLL